MLYHRDRKYVRCCVWALNLFCNHLDVLKINPSTLALCILWLFFNNFIPFCHLGFPLMVICLITTSNHMSWRTYLKVSGIFSLFKYFYLTFIQSWDFCTLYFAPKRNFQYVDVLVPLCRSHPVTLLFPLQNTSVSLQVPTQAIPLFCH